MPDFEPDEDSIASADRFSSRLMEDLRMATEEGPSPKMERELFSERRYAEQAEGVPVNDVVTNVGRMAEEFALARRWDGQVACLELGDGNMAPISMAGMFGGPYGSDFNSVEWIEFWERYGPFPPPPHRYWREFIRRSERGGERVVVTDLRRAIRSVERNLRGFLSYRFAGMKMWRQWIQGIGGGFSGGSKGPPPSKGSGGSSPPPPPAVGPGGGLHVQVSCTTPGLRIHVSPAYFITWVFFGCPSTPVTSYVLPGRYVFAGDGPMLTRQTKDTGVFCIPPIYNPVLTKF